MINLPIVIKIYRNQIFLKVNKISLITPPNKVADNDHLVIFYLSLGVFQGLNEQMHVKSTVIGCQHSLNISCSHANKYANIKVFEFMQK